MASGIFQYVVASWPNQNLLGVDVCMGLPLTKVVKSSPRTIGVEIPTLILQLVIFVRIAMYKRKLKNKPQSTNCPKNQHMAEMEKSSLLTFSSNLSLGIIAILILSAFFYFNSVDGCKRIIFPYSITFLFTFLIFPSLASFIIPFSLYFFNPYVRQTFVREWKLYFQ